MKRTLTTSEAVQMLLADDYASWTRAGAYALIIALEEIERDSGDYIEFNEAAIRCDFSEYATAVDAAKNYSFEPSAGLSDDALENAALEYLQDRTFVIEFTGGIIIQNF